MRIKRLCQAVFINALWLIALTLPPVILAQEEGTLERHRIRSRALEGNLIGDPADREYWIYLPPSYNEDTKRHYPAFYVLHGFTADPMKPRTAGSLTRKVKRAMDLLVQMGEIEEMIAVFVDGSNRFGGSQYLSSSTIGDYETYIVTDLVDRIDTNFRTIPHRSSRGITGFSMGGYGSMNLALKHPDIFSVVVTQASTYDFSGTYVQFFVEAAGVVFSVIDWVLTEYPEGLQDMEVLDAFTISEALVDYVLERLPHAKGLPDESRETFIETVSIVLGIGAHLFDEANGPGIWGDLGINKEEAFDQVPKEIRDAIRESEDLVESIFEGLRVNPWEVFAQLPLPLRNGLAYLAGVAPANDGPFFLDLPYTVRANRGKFLSIEPVNTVQANILENDTIHQLDRAVEKHPILVKEKMRFKLVHSINDRVAPFRQVMQLNRKMTLLGLKFFFAEHLEGHTFIAEQSLTYLSQHLELDPEPEKDEKEDEEEEEGRTVQPRDKLSITWGEIKRRQ